ncbi:MAG: hypothetical protein QXY15_09755 [Candidatus Nitrosotenuis sp.]
MTVSPFDSKEEPDMIFPEEKPNFVILFFYIADDLDAAFDQNIVSAQKGQTCNHKTLNSIHVTFLKAALDTPQNIIFDCLTTYSLF